jgi:hypothetical protein
MWQLITLLVALAARPVDLLRLDAASLGGLPAEWTIRGVRSQALPEFAVVDADGKKILRVTGHAAAGWAYRELAEPIPPTEGALRWLWRVREAPDGGDLRRRDADDAALRVFVVFGRSGGLSRHSHAIFYTWGNGEPAGLSLPSRVSSKLHVVRLAGAEEVGQQWHPASVDPFADYRRIWSREPEPISAVGVMQDTDMTHASAIAELRDLLWDAR